MWRIRTGTTTPIRVEFQLVQDLVNRSRSPVSRFDNGRRPSSAYNERRDLRRNDTRRPHQRSQSRHRNQESNDRASRARHNATDRASFDWFELEYRNPTQILNEGTARRQQQLRSEARRHEPLYTYPEPARRSLNNVWFRPGYNGSRENHAIAPSSFDEPIIKKEPSEPGEVPQSVARVPHTIEKNTLPHRKSREQSTYPDSDRDPAQRQDPPDEPEIEGRSPPPVDRRDAAVVKKKCTCPIDKICEARLYGLVDCRTLVLEKDWSKWEKASKERYRPEYAFHCSG